MKKLAMLALAATLSFGSAVPAFAVGPHHNAAQCLDYAAVCHRVAQGAIAPGLQSLSERLSAALAQANSAGMAGAAGATGAVGAAGVASVASRQVDTYATSPSLCANGACEMYLDANADGICDYHGADCPNMGGRSNGNAGDGFNNGQNSGSYRSGHHGNGNHHGFSCH